jgi:hypothetical protein
VRCSGTGKERAAKIANSPGPSKRDGKKFRREAEGKKS